MKNLVDNGNLCSLLKLTNKNRDIISYALILIKDYTYALIKKKQYFIIYFNLDTPKCSPFNFKIKQIMNFLYFFYNGYYRQEK